MFFFLLLLLIIATIVEGTVTTLPLVFICLLCLTIITRDTIVFLVVFIAGLLLDVFALRPLGESSMLLLLFVFLLLLYQRKYEIYSYQFVFVSSFVGSGIFLMVFGYQNVIWQAGISAVIASIFFALIKIFVKKESVNPELGIMNHGKKFHS